MRSTISFPSSCSEPTTSATCGPNGTTPNGNAYVKNHLENRLHELVCDHRPTLEAAQSAIVTNWILAYKTYVAPEPQGETAEYDPETFKR
jgi:hypothetical protein